MRLPVVAKIAPGESLTSNVRRCLALTGYNDLREGRAGAGTWRRVTNFASAKQVDAWCQLSGFDRPTVLASTFARYADAVPAFNDVLNGTVQVTAAARRTWMWPGTTQACRECLLERPDTWMLGWRLPWTFSCPLHRTYLVTHCPRCGRLFTEAHRCPARTYRQDAWLRWEYEAPLWGQVPSEGELAAAQLVNRALLGCSMQVHGSMEVPAAVYLDSVRGLTGVLFHAQHARRSGDAHRAPVGAQRPAGARRAVAAPPRDAAQRSALIAEAVGLLGMLQEEAAATVRRRVASVRDPSGLRAWLSDHSLATTLTSDLFDRVVGAHASIGRLRPPNRPEPVIDASWMPQLVWVYQWETLRPLSSASDVTGRAFSMLVLVKHQAGGTWGEAATAFGFPAAMGMNVARVGVRSLNVDAREFLSAAADALAAAKAMGVAVDYGLRRHRAAALGQDPDAVAALREHLNGPHFNDHFLRERVWTLWALGHPALNRSADERPLDRQRAATQRHRWTATNTAALLAWCDGHLL